MNWWGLGFTFYALDLALSLQEEYGAEESHVATHALGVGTVRMVGLGEYMWILNSDETLTKCFEKQYYKGEFIKMFYADFVKI